MKQQLLNFLKSPRFVLLLFSSVTVIASILLVAAGQRNIDGCWYYCYNNYVVFKQSWFHLISGNDLYVLDLWSKPDHVLWDYKYSPTFSVFMSLFAYLPDYLGVTLWNLLNALLLFYAITKLPFISAKNKTYIGLFVFFELITSVQNCQSNALIAASLILAFINFENKKCFLATLWISLTVFIKIFSVVGFLLILLYPQKKKSVLYAALNMILLAFIPILIVGLEQLIHHYHYWWLLLQRDHSSSFGLSVMGWLNTWFGYKGNGSVVLIAGLSLFLIPFLRPRYFFLYKYRIMLLSSILIWVVIFNHKAESPTFIIAATGVAIWLFSQSLSPLNIVIGVLVFLLTTLSPTDLFPKYIRDNFVIPYTLKAVPCILAWLKISYDLLFFKSTTDVSLTEPPISSQ